MVKKLLANAGDIRDRVQSLGEKDSLRAGMATRSSILAWRMPWTEEPGGPQSMGSQRVRHDWVTEHTQRGWSDSLKLRTVVLSCLCCPLPTAHPLFTPLNKSAAPRVPWHPPFLAPKFLSILHHPLLISVAVSRGDVRRHDKSHDRNGPCLALTECCT